MNHQLFLIDCVIIQVIMTFILLYTMGFYRVKSIAVGEVKIKDVATALDNWPIKVRQISNCFHNQLETPILFYVLVLMVIFLGKPDIIFSVLAGIFIVFRILHALEEVRRNHVPTRFKYFTVASAALFFSWIYLGYIVTQSALF